MARRPDGSRAAGRVRAAAVFDERGGRHALRQVSPKPANLNFVLKDIDRQEFQPGVAEGQGRSSSTSGPRGARRARWRFPGSSNFRTKYGPKGFTVIGVSVDDPLEKLKPFVAAVQDELSRCSSATGATTSWAEGLRHRRGVFPKTFVIGRDGRICKTHLGLSAKEKFEQEIKALL